MVIGLALVTGLKALMRDERPAPALSAALAPWPAPDQPDRRIEAAKLPPYEENSGATHDHVHLDIFVEGSRVPVVAGLGLTAPYAAVHTHSDSGLLHVESKKRTATVTLGQFFTVWGVRLSGLCAGGYCAPTMQPVLYVNGIEHDGDPASATLRSGDQLALVIGAPPSSIPSTYDCQNAADLERDSCRRSFRERRPAG